MTDFPYPAEDWAVEGPIRPSDADRMLWRIRQIEAEVAANHDLAMGEINDIVAWEARRGEALVDEKAVLEARLEDWARANHRENGQVSWDLPHGVIRLSAPRYSAVVEDEEEAVKGLLAAGEEGLVRTVQTVRKGDLLAATVGKVSPRPDSGVLPIERPADEPEFLDYFQAVLAGEVVAGVHLTRPSQRSFSQRPPRPAESGQESEESDAD